MPSVSRHVDLPPELVWALLIDTSVWHVWGPTVTDVEAPERRIRRGTRGRVRTLGGVWLPFEVTEFDPGRRWAWAVAGIAATGHVVEPATGGGTRVTFEVPSWAGPYAAVCWLAAGRLPRAADVLERAG